MVEDLPGNHTSGYLPILDTAMKVKEEQIRFIHYSKPMSSLEVVSSRSAMSYSSKISILTQEGSMRLRNCDLDTPWETKVSFINKLMIKMMWSGHTEATREVVARRILARYTTNLQNYNLYGRTLYRTKE